MVKNVGVEMRQPDRTTVGNKMYFMTPAGQSHAQFGCNNTRAAISGVTNNTYFHEIPAADAPFRYSDVAYIFHACVPPRCVLFFFVIE